MKSRNESRTKLPFLKPRERLLSEPVVVLPLLAALVLGVPVSLDLVAPVDLPGLPIGLLITITKLKPIFNQMSKRIDI
jgi:hypothetical protein